jgi:hypothetical protein
MILHKNTLISFDVFQKKFICHLEKCLGACCKEGNYGAPLEEYEINYLEKNISRIKPYMTKEALKLLEAEGFMGKDPENSIVTLCLQTGECVFVYADKGIIKCAIEKAFLEKKIKFQKPVSCHLYPIRLEKLKQYTAINYHHWHICEPACILGEKMDVPVYKFLKDALVRKFGKRWYQGLEKIAGEIDLDEIMKFRQQKPGVSKDQATE